MKELCIKDICKKDSSSLKQKELKESGRYPVYGASGVAGYLDSYQQGESYIGIVKDGSGIGRVALYPEKTSLIGTMQYILPKEGYDIRYIGYCLQSLDLSKYKQGAAIPHIYFRDYGERKVNVTDDLKEQQRIVSRLDSAFAHIDELKANAEKQLSEAHALFQKALTKAMEPKEGWEEKTLSSIVHQKCSLSYGIVQPGDHVENGVPVVRPVDFNNKIIVEVEGLKRTKKEISDAYKRTILKGGEILFCVRGTTGTMGLASKELSGCNVTRGIVPMFFDEDTNLMFVYYQLLSPRLQDEIQKKTTGAALKQINIKDLRNLQLNLPSLSEQRRIVSRLDSLSAHVRELEEVLQKTIAECDALKQALLRKVFE